VRPSDEDLEALRGKTAEDVVKALVPDGWEILPSRTGGGIRYRDGKGNQVRIMPGDPAAPDPTHRGPYAYVTLDGKPTRLPLAGNPVLSGE
jgi:hypothetical protein